MSITAALGEGYVEPPRGYVDPPEPDIADVAYPYPEPNPLSRRNIAPFVRPGLSHDDIDLIIQLADIAGSGGSGTVMRCLGIVARNPTDAQDTLAENEDKPPNERLDPLVLRGLEAALAVRKSKLEGRFEPSPVVRAALLQIPRYQVLHGENQRAPTDKSHRALQYYALGTLAGWLASLRPNIPVQ